MSVQQELEDLRREIAEEVDRIWLDEPDEVRKFRLGVIDSGAGSYGQYFTTLVFADGEVRALGYLCYTTILNAVKDPDFGLEHVRKLAKMLVPVCAEFLGYCGLTKIWDFSRRFLELIERVESKEELEDVVRSLVLYVNRIHGWMHFYFPWGLGSQYRQRTKEDIEELSLLIKNREEG